MCVKKRTEFKEGVIKNVRIVYNARIDIINGFKDGLFFRKPDIASKKIPEWVEINNYSFNALNDKIDNAVNKNLGPILNKEKISYLLLQNFL